MGRIERVLPFSDARRTDDFVIIETAHLERLELQLAQARADAARWKGSAKQYREAWQFLMDELRHIRHKGDQS